MEKTFKMCKHKYAPVLVTTYNRYHHFVNCIQSLQNNIEAQNTSLFIAIDAPSKEKDIEPNEEIVRFSNKIKGFKSISIIHRKVNMGAFKNMFDARNQIFSESPTLILSEDDNVYSPFFLQFINEGLKIYENNPTIFSISGYNYPVFIQANETRDFYFAQAYSAWGVGLWRDKFNLVDFDSSHFWSDFSNPLKWLRLNKTLGDHVFIHLLISKLRQTIFEDTCICYHQFKNQMLSVFPSISLVRNMGHDGSGVHCSAKSKNIFENQRIWEKITPPSIYFTQITKESNEARTELNKYFKHPMYKKIACYFLYLFKSFTRNKLKYY